MARDRAANRLTNDEEIPSQDDSRPNGESSSKGTFELNFCRECKSYKWVYSDVDLKDGKGPGRVCGRCRRLAAEQAVTRSA